MRDLSQKFKQWTHVEYAWNTLKNMQGSQKDQKWRGNNLETVSLEVVEIHFTHRWWRSKLLANQLSAWESTLQWMQLLTKPPLTSEMSNEDKCSVDHKNATTPQICINCSHNNYFCRYYYFHITLPRKARPFYEQFLQLQLVHSILPTKWLNDNDNMGEDATF